MGAAAVISPEPWRAKGLPKNLSPRREWARKHGLAIFQQVLNQCGVSNGEIAVRFGVSGDRFGAQVRHYGTVISGDEAAFLLPFKASCLFALALLQSRLELKRIGKPTSREATVIELAIPAVKQLRTLFSAL